MEIKVMKHMFLVFSIIICFSCNNVNKTFFKVIEEQRDVPAKEVEKYYRITLESAHIPINYPIDVSRYSEKEKLQMINELLKFKDNDKICVFNISNYSAKVSQIYIKSKRDYSLQLEALFLINQVFFDKPFDYSPIPILIDNKTGEEQTVKGEIIEEAYEKYEKWYNKIKKIGIKESLNRKVYPLDESNISWIYGS